VKSLLSKLRTERICAGGREYTSGSLQTSVMGAVLSGTGYLKLCVCLLGGISWKSGVGSVGVIEIALGRTLELVGLSVSLLDCERYSDSLSNPGSR
jgi:hypothetical protein